MEQYTWRALALSGRKPPGEGAGVMAMRLPREQGGGQAAVWKLHGAAPVFRR